MLRTSVVADRTIIDYLYDPTENVHYVDVWGMLGSGRSYQGTKGEMANVVAPYRGIPEVDELFSWLCK